MYNAFALSTMRLSWPSYRARLTARCKKVLAIIFAGSENLTQKGRIDPKICSSKDGYQLCNCQNRPLLSISFSPENKREREIKASQLHRIRTSFIKWTICSRFAENFKVGTPCIVKFSQKRQFQHWQIPALARGLEIAMCMCWGIKGPVMNISKAEGWRPVPQKHSNQYSLIADSANAHTRWIFVSYAENMSCSTQSTLCLKANMCSQHLITANLSLYCR